MVKSGLRYLILTTTFLKSRNRNSISLSPTSLEEVLKDFSETKSAGPHSIPMRILNKLLKLDIASSISTLINRSFEMGIFPTLLKTSKVLPIFRNKESPMNFSNYCHIAFLSNIEKIMKRWFNSRLVAFLNSHILIYNLDFIKVIQLFMLLLTPQCIRKCLDIREFLQAMNLSIYKKPLTL